MMEWNDPHETAQRLIDFQKNSDLEGSLCQLNDAIRNLKFEQPTADSFQPIIFIVGLPRSGTTRFPTFFSLS
jgi:uncharacterized metal-binding protein YceD (DUF177 family)